MCDQGRLDHKAREDLRVISDHPDPLDSLASQDRRATQASPAHSDQPDQPARLDLLETQDIREIVDFRGLQDLQVHSARKDLRDQLDSRDSSDLLDRQVGIKSYCFYHVSTQVNDYTICECWWYICRLLVKFADLRPAYDSCRYVVNFRPNLHSYVRHIS